MTIICFPRQSILDYRLYRVKCALMFSKMFPDSKIAKKYQMHKSKLCYVVEYGLAPHYKRMPKTNSTVSISRKLRLARSRNSMMAMPHTKQIQGS